LSEYAGDYANPGYGTLTVGLPAEQLSLTTTSTASPRRWSTGTTTSSAGCGTRADPTFENMKYNFRTNLRGDIDAVAAPFEPNVDPIVFARQPDRELLDPAFLTRLTGRYYLTDTTRVTLKGNALVVQTGNGAPIELVPYRRTEFTFKGLAGTSVEFVLDAQRRPVTLRVKQPNGVFESKRVEP